MVVGGMVIMRAWKHLLVLAAALFVTMMLVSCSGSGSQVETAQATPVAAQPVSTPIAPPDSKISGTLVVENQVDVAALRDGVVTTVVADVDTPVKKGQILATLDDRQITADRDAAAAKVGEYESDLKNWEAEVKVLDSDRERAEKMWEAQLITKEQVDHIRYNLEADKFQTQSAQHKLDNAHDVLQSLQLEWEKTRIRAPFDGVVARRYIRMGQRVAVGDRTFWVTSVSPLLVRFTVPAQTSSHLHRGELVDVTTGDTNATVHQAKITSLSPVVDPASSTVEAEAQIDGPPADLRPGLTVNIALRER